MFDGMFSKNIQWETTGYMTLSNHQYYLVGGLEHFLFFHSVGNFMIPTEFVHDYSEG
jgi:hypothetical protein